jgi:hypothetical protein
MLVKTCKILAITIPLLLLEVGVFQFDNNIATAQRSTSTSTSSRSGQCQTFYQRYRCGYQNRQICSYPVTRCR